MQNNYLSVYIRRLFTIEDPDQVKLIELGVEYDDGFIAYVNGVEIVRVGLTGAPFTLVPHDATATSHDVTGTPTWYEFPADVVASLEAGENVLALQGHNTSLTSSDLSLIPQVRLYTSLCPTNFTCTSSNETTVRLRWQHVVSPVPYDAVEIRRNGEVIGSPSTLTSTTFTDSAPVPGLNTYELAATIDGEPCGAEFPACEIVISGGTSSFRRGDTDDDGVVNITDGVSTLLYLFQGGPAPSCPDAADADDDGQVSLTDAVFLLLHLFQGGPEPPPPGITECGLDLTGDDALGACLTTSC
jgi:hypothetical protein